MKIAIMQPYLFPYIGYFQLLDAVDKFVFLDDVNYIKAGWINRNRLFLAGAIRYFTVPLAGASQFEKINRTCVLPREAWVTSILSSIRQSYRAAPFYQPVSELIAEILSSEETSIGELARTSVIKTARYLGLQTEFVPTSEVYGNQALKGAERLAAICVAEGANEYWNLPGGRSLYENIQFSPHGIALNFVDVALREYRQTTPEFIAGLSIIDAMMFNAPEHVRDALIRTPATAGAN